jgi:hypothetical protein
MDFRFLATDNNAEFNGTAAEAHTKQWGHWPLRRKPQRTAEGTFRFVVRIPIMLGYNVVQWSPNYFNVALLS